MNDAGLWAVVVLLAYLLGAIPFGYLTARAVAGIDIRKAGSGNIGATNVGRLIGLRWGALVLVLDCLKGLLPAWGLPYLLADAHSAGLVHARVACGVAAILGHMFPCWLRFRGGKGVATGLGVIAVVSPWGTLAAVLMFAIVFLACRIVSLGSILAAVTFAGTQLAILWPRPFSADQWSLAAFSLLLPALIIVRHRANIRRLIRGQEPAMRRHRRDQEQPRPEDVNAP